MLPLVPYDQIYLLLVLNWIFWWMMTSSLCLGYWFRLSIFPSLLFPWQYIISYHIYVRPCCGCNILCNYFVCFIPKYGCWLFYSLFVYLFHLKRFHEYLSFHYRLQYLYWVHFSLWSSHIGSCWLCITYFIHSSNFNLFLVFLNWCILFPFDCTIMIT